MHVLFDVCWTFLFVRTSPGSFRSSSIKLSYNQLWSRVRRKQHAAAHTSLNELFWGFFPVMLLSSLSHRYIWSQDSCLTYVSVEEEDQVWVVIYWNEDNRMSCDLSNPSFCRMLNVGVKMMCFWRMVSHILFRCMAVTAITVTGSGIYVKAVIIKLSWFNTHQASDDSFSVGVGV